VALNDGQVTGSGAIPKGLLYSPYNQLATIHLPTITTSQDVREEVKLNDR